jgi:hypothetical protein
MDFQRCELVVAFEPPSDVTSYIQVRCPTIGFDSCCSAECIRGSGRVNIVQSLEAMRCYMEHVMVSRSHIGSESMDFQRCELVVAFEPPSDVTSYIQVRCPANTFAALQSVSGAQVVSALCRAWR